MLTVRVIEYASPDYDQALRLRYDVLRKPLQLEYTVEQIESEWQDLHLGLFNEYNELLAYLMMVNLTDSLCQMRQVVVDVNHQHSGYGSLLVHASEDWARDQHFDKVILHARAAAVPFYHKLKYQIEGKPFIEVGIEHFNMYKVL